MSVVLTIAGSDPSGGAGIQADLRTLNALGVDGRSVVTAITVQNSQGVHAVYPVEPDILAAQLNKLLEEEKPDAIKIGMLGGVNQVAALAANFEKRRPKNVVLDPVLASTGGVPLLDTAGRYLLLTDLMAHCSVITPNIDEAAQLSGISVYNDETMCATGRKLLSLGAKAVLVKGGHLKGEPIDWLIQRDVDPISFTSRRILTRHTHGSGCLLSTAIAAGLASGLSLQIAVQNAKSLLVDSLRSPFEAPNGRGYPDALKAVRARTVDSAAHSDRVSRIRGIYIVTDRMQQRGRSYEQVTLEAIQGGAQIVQLRDKVLPTPDLIAEARRLSALVRGFGKLFIVNDRVDVALASDADGVHLGPGDMLPADARNLLGPDKLIGVSTGTVEEAMSAAPYASYFGVGAIFGSKTKTDAGDPVTPKRITEIKKIFPQIPVVAIGGIDASSIQSVIDAGADSAALVSAVLGAQDIERAAKVLAAYFAH